MNTSRKRWAFTMIELLIVFVIIMILAALLVPVIREARESARKARCGTNMAGFGKVLLTYAARNEGLLPTLAAQGDGYYDRSSLFEQFCVANSVPIELAYSPSRPISTASAASYVPRRLDADWHSPARIILDNSGDGTPSHASTQTWVKDNQQGGSVFATSGIWEEESHAQAENQRGTKLNTVLSSTGWARWTFDLGGVSGSGTMQILVKMRKWPGGHPTVRYKVYGTRDEVQNNRPQATINQSHNATTESYEWVSLGTFNIEGQNSPYVTLENVGPGYPTGIPTTMAITPIAILPYTNDRANGIYFERAGAWVEQTWGSFRVGRYWYWSDAVTSAPTATVSWWFRVPKPPDARLAEGNLSVEAYWRRESTAQNNAVYTVHHKDGTSAITVNQYATTASGGYNVLGTFPFVCGEQYRVVFTNQVAATPSPVSTAIRVHMDSVRISGNVTVWSVPATNVWADAIKMEGTWGAAVAPSPGYFVTEGTWTRETSGTGNYGADYHRKARNEGAAKAVWCFRVDQDQEYEVFGYWPAAPTNVSDATFRVVGADGTTNLTIDQTDTDRNGAWRSLCRARFCPTTLGYVEIDSSGPSEARTVVADAIAVVPVTTIYVDPKPVIGYHFFGYRRDNREGYPSSGIISGETIVTPISVRDVGHPGTVPILADLLCSNASGYTTHQDGVHILYLDGRVEWIPAEATRERWVDCYGNRFRW